jgi:hypothetical protein
MDVASIFDGAHTASAAADQVIASDGVVEAQKEVDAFSSTQVSPAILQAAERVEGTLVVPVLPTKDSTKLNSTKIDQVAAKIRLSAKAGEEKTHVESTDPMGKMPEAQNSHNLPIETSNAKSRKSLPAVKSARDSKPSAKLKAPTMRESLRGSMNRIAEDAPTIAQQQRKTGNSHNQSALTKLRSKRSHGTIATKPNDTPADDPKSNVDVYSFPEELVSTSKVYTKNAKKMKLDKTKMSSLTESSKQMKIDQLPLSKPSPEIIAKPTNNPASKSLLDEDVEKVRTREEMSELHKPEPSTPEGVPVDEDTIVVSHTKTSAQKRVSLEGRQNDSSVKRDKSVSKMSNSVDHEDNSKMNHQPASITMPRSHVKGSTQQDAFVLSDGDESSEDEYVTEQLRQVPIHRPHVPLEAKDTTQTKIPRTPAYQTENLPTPINTARKTPIIAFDKSGPRNQGSSSSKRKTVYKARPSKRAPLRSKDPNLKMNSGEISAQGSSVVPQNLRSKTKLAKPSTGNVASTVNVALAGLLPSKRQAETTKATEASPKRHKTDHNSDSVAPAAKSERPHGNGDEDMADGILYTFDDFVKSSPLPQESLPEESHAALRTASQLAMPPPKQERQQNKNAQPSIETHRENLSHDEHVTTTRSKEKALKQSHKSHESNRSSSLTRKPEIQVSAKRSKFSMDSVEKPPSHESNRLPRQKTPPEAQMATVSTSLKNNRDKIVPRKRSSQTVDVRGSPIPKNMGDLNHTTVLETYRQQTQQNPDVEDDFNALEAPGVASRNGLSVPLDPLFSRRVKPPLLSSDGILSSRKPQPASPLATSEVLSGLRTRESDNALLLGRASVDTAIPNLFARGSVQKGEDLKQEPSRPSPPDPTQKLDEQLDLLRHRLGKTATITLTTHPAVQTAPTTLVASRDHTIRALHAGHALLTADPRKSPSHPNNTSSDPTQTENLTIWRTALAPHHATLFDDLVSLAHQATQSLIDQDLAFAQSLSDYQVRSQNIISQWEAHQKKFYSQLQASLAKKRALVKAELRDYSGMLKGCGKVIEEVRMEWERNGLEREKVYRDIEAVVERFGQESVDDGE